MRTILSVGLVPILLLAACVGACSDDPPVSNGYPSGDSLAGDGSASGDGSGGDGISPGDAVMGDAPFGDPAMGDALSGDSMPGDPSCDPAAGGCCTASSFCPTTDTTLAGPQAFDYVFIPAGVTVTCEGSEPLHLTVSGAVVIDGVLAADGAAGSGSSDGDAVGTCGGFSGGDGFRACTSGWTTFCETDPTSEAECQALISPKETVVGAVCEYLSNAPGEPGYGAGGGLGGEMAHPLMDSAPGSSGGGGGGSYQTTGTAGGDGSTNCPSTPAGGSAGPTVAHAGGVPVGGSGGGGGGQARNGDCADVCAGGCTGWGGDGGAGGGVILVDAGGEVRVDGRISARGGDGSEGGGAVCTGSGGGGSGGAIRVSAPALVLPGALADHLDVRGGVGGAEACTGLGLGGDGGEGLLLTP